MDYEFGVDICEQFCHKNNVQMMARSGGLVMEGYKYIFDKKLVTIYSTPNLVGRCGNRAAVMEVDEHYEKRFHVFREAPQVQHLRTTQFYGFSH
eukprot:SAG31_NODE_894_length_11172_cov_25.790572_2_plen_94_part_00